MKKMNLAIFILYVLLAIYVINSAISFISMPEFISKLDKPIMVITGIFLILGGINFVKSKRHQMRF